MRPRSLRVTGAVHDRPRRVRRHLGHRRPALPPALHRARPSWSWSARGVHRLRGDRAGPDSVGPTTRATAGRATSTAAAQLAVYELARRRCAAAGAIGVRAGPPADRRPAPPPAGLTPLDQAITARPAGASPGPDLQQRRPRVRTRARPASGSGWSSAGWLLDDATAPGPCVWGAVLRARARRARRRPDGRRPDQRPPGRLTCCSPWSARRGVGPAAAPVPRPHPGRPKRRCAGLREQHHHLAPGQAPA